MFSWWFLGVWAAAPEGSSPWEQLRIVAAPTDAPTRYQAWRAIEGLPSDTLACDAVWPDAVLLCFRVWEGEKRRWVGTSDLASWQVDTAGLRERLAAKADERIAAAELVPIGGMDTSYLRLVDGDGWAAAGLLRPEQLAARLGGVPIRVAVPSEGVLVAWRAQGPDVDKVMAVGVRELYEQQPGAVSPRVYQWDGTQWLPFGEALPKPRLP